jgi:hypothetical protein
MKHVRVARFYEKMVVITYGNNLERKMPVELESTHHQRPVWAHPNARLRDGHCKWARPTFGDDK